MDPSITEYLERLNAALDAHTNAVESLNAKVDALVVAWRPDLEKRSSHTVVVQNPPAPTPALETTTGASAPVPDDSCSTTKAQEGLEVIHDAAPACSAMARVTCSTECSHQVATTDIVNKVRDATDCIARALMTCSMDCSNQVIGTPAFASPTTLMSLLPAASPAPVTDSVHRATDGDSILRVPLAMEDVLVLTQAPPMVPVVTSLQLLVNHDLDESLPTKCSQVCLSDTPMSSLRMMASPRIRHQTLVLRPTPWPSLLKDPTEGNKVRPIPWPSFACLISMVPRDTPVLSQPIMQVMGDLNLGVVEWRLVICSMAAHLFQSMQQMGALSTGCSNNIFLQFMQIGPYELGCAAVVYLLEDYLRPVNLELRREWPPLVKANFSELCSFR